jgi:hypothetical protein
LPYFVVALRALAARGLGAPRGRLEVESVVAETPAGEKVVFEKGRPEVSAVSEGYRLPHLLCAGDSTAQLIAVRFLSPTTLKREGRPIEQPAFADLICRLRDRLSSLAAFFGEGPITMDFAGVGNAAGAVRTVACSTTWERRSRRSARTGRSHEISGFVGDAVYAGDLGPFMPLLRIGEQVHAGKYAVWGNGRMAVDVLEPSGPEVAAS